MRGKDQVCTGLEDIGANVGAYTIYAAVSKDIPVYAFEPAFHSYYLLNRNIALNGLTDVKAYNLALSGEQSIASICAVAQRRCRTSGFGRSSSSSMRAMRIARKWSG